jgi:hypothetical protein
LASFFTSTSSAAHSGRTGGELPLAFVALSVDAAGRVKNNPKALQDMRTSILKVSQSSIDSDSWANVYSMSPTTRLGINISLAV